MQSGKRNPSEAEVNQRRGGGENKSMKIARFMSFVLLASSLLWGQSSTVSNGSTGDTSQIAEQIKALQARMAEQQKQLEDLQRQLSEQKNAAPKVVNASLNTAGTTDASATQADVQKPKESPLSFRIGGTDFTPGGFVDFTNIFRTTNTGSAVSTSFSTIPYSNTPQGHLTEFRSSGQYSRFNLKINGKYGENKFTGFIEADFNGNDPANVFVTTNPHTFRLRLYYLQVERGKIEFTAGQAWGLLTPNKIGVGATPSNLDTTLATDGNIMTGVMYSREAQLRLAWNPNDKFGWAVEIANPQQITTGAVTFPAAFPIQTQVDGSVTAGVPNLIPDFSTKLAWDTNRTGKNFHFEIGGIITSAQVAVPSPGAPSTGPFTKNSKIGGGGFGGVGISFSKKFRIVAHGMYGDGVGRYFIGSGPQFVVVPIVVTPTTFMAKPSMVHSGSGYAGAEWQAGANTQIAAYYGGIYYGRNSFVDVTSTAVPQPIIGYGGIGSSNSNNRAIQQGEFVLAHTMWKNPQYGAVVLVSDSSYVTRAPWFHAITAPKNAHMFMTKIDFKYVIP
jgi:hypothetical protein